MKKQYHSIIVNREVSAGGGRYMFVPYCFCTWKGRECYTVEEAYRIGQEYHLGYPKGQIT